LRGCVPLWIFLVHQQTRKEPLPHVLAGRLDKWLVVRWFSSGLNTWKYQDNYCNYAH